MNYPNPSSCPKCGASIPENAPQGLCPKCVLDAASLLDPPKSPAGKTPAPTIAELAPHFPELEILELIGAGGMGAVYKARQPKLDRLVALKILAHDLSKDPAFAERFNREARVLARLNHQNIVTVFDFGTQGPFCFLLMEFMDGVNLRQAMRAGRFTPVETLTLVQDICAALKFAHEEGILHRDIKPENVLIDSRGRVKIADFGIAKLVGKDERDDVTLTQQGAILGTAHYMAPEQIETPGEVDQRADIYSLGVVFYELLTRELPIGRFAPPSERSPMDPRIDEIVMRALEKDRKARYQTVGEVKKGVEAITGSQPVAPKAAGGTGGNQPPPIQPPASFGTSPVEFNPPPHPIPWTAAIVFSILAVIAEVIMDGMKLAGEMRDREVRIVISLIYLAFGIPSLLLWCILHYRCWKAIPERFRAITPGSAVGFLFIPFFNFYWAFVTWPKLAESLTAWQRSIGRTHIVNVQGLAVTYGILFVLSWTLAIIPGFASLISIVDLVIFIIFYAAVTKTINGIRQHSHG